MIEKYPAAGRFLEDIRPKVAQPTSRLGLIIGAGALVAMSAGIFYALQIRRIEITEGNRRDAGTASGPIIQSPPELVLPRYSAAQEPLTYEMSGAVMPRAPELTSTRPVILNQSPRTSSRQRRGPGQMPSQSYPASTEAWRPAYDINGAASLPPAVPQPAANPSSFVSTSGSATQDRVSASRFLNPDMTVSQGTVIQAVMETALDSTRPGFARALVSRDVKSFDGGRVLIPKGSKLFGDYKADVSTGQKRALIQWHRLTRPDGVIIDVDSPSADPLGRAGVEGRVNSHFFERFGGVILQSVLDLGVRAATTKAAGNTVVLGLPGSQGSLVQSPEDIPPTLKVRQGTSVSVFVSRDLDFSSVE